MPYEILQIGTVAGTTLTRCVVRSWKAAEDKANEFRPRIESHDFGPEFLVAARVRLVRDAQGRYQRKSDGAWIDVLPLRSADRPKTNDLVSETVGGNPHEKILDWLDRYYSNLYADDASDSTPIDDSDPAGVFAHPGMANLRSQVREGAFSLRDERGRSK